MGLPVLMLVGLAASTSAFVRTRASMVALRLMTSQAAR